MIKILTLFAVIFLVGCVGNPTPGQRSASSLEVNVSESDNNTSPFWTRSAFDNHFKEWESVRYRFGGLSKRGVDCSGFVYLTFLHQFGVKLPRDTSRQAQLGKSIHQHQLQTGDLVFFRTKSATRRHVGIYLSDRRFMHASTSQGVTTSSLDESYWANAYWKAKRLSPTQLNRTPFDPS
jgi:probable lipoprotein NlpC